MDNRTTCVNEYPLTTPIMVGDKAEDGSQLRPYIVMFGEYVDSMNVAIKYVSYADIFVVIGTSLQVYPAAGFINYAQGENKEQRHITPVLSGIKQTEVRKC